MRARLPALVPVLAFLACTERPLGGDTDTASSTTGSGTSAASTTTSTTATSSVPLPTTSGVTTSATTGPVGTVTSDASDVTGVPPMTTNDVKLDFERPPPPPPTGGLSGCPLDAPAGTELAGQTILGPFVGNRAYFGTVSFGGDPNSPVLLILSPEADAAAEIEERQGDTGAIIVGYPQTDSLMQGWVGLWTYVADILAGGQIGNVNSDIVIESLQGNWDAVDPDDPPRLVGTIAGRAPDAVSGSFNAVYCDKLSEFIIAE